MDSLIQGIWIINARQQEISNVLVDNFTTIQHVFMAAMAFVIIFVVGAVVCGIAGLSDKMFIVCGAVAFFISLFLFHSLQHQDLTESSKEYETVYDIIIGDEVSFNDFNEHYEIIDQNGNIYTVREKNNGTNVCE